MEVKKICEIVEETETVTKEKMEKKVTADEEKQREEKKRRENTTKSSSIGKLCQVFLRLLVIGSMAAACLIMVFNEETVDMGEFLMRVSYRVSPTFKFYMSGTGVVCVYGMLSLPMVYCCYNNRFFRLFDMIMMALAVASAASATSVGYIAKFGNDTAGWMGVCDYCELYCMRSMISVILCYIGIICLLIICATSSLAKK